MSKQSVTFEQEIHRLHELVERSAAKVTWNDHIPDPDNPQQPRQIDVTIRRGGALTIVECRLHKSRQGVKWIEELIGRRSSMRAACAIAVSASGFTRGAIRKAKSFGILLRDLKELTPGDIEQWGCLIAMRVYYYQFQNLELSLGFAPDSIALLDDARLKVELQAFPGTQSLINAAVNQLDELKLLTDEDLRKKSHSFQVTGRFEDFRVCDQRVLETALAGGARLVDQEMSLPVVLAYGEPEEGSSTRNVVMQKAASGATGFIVHEGWRMATTVDLSQLELPPNCQFRYVRTTAPRVMDVDSFELLGTDRLRFTGGRMTVNIYAIMARTDRSGD